MLMNAHSVRYRWTHSRVKTALGNSGGHHMMARGGVSMAEVPVAPRQAAGEVKRRSTKLPQHEMVGRH